MFGKIDHDVCRWSVLKKQHPFCFIHKRVTSWLINGVDRKV